MIVKGQGWAQLAHLFRGGIDEIFSKIFTWPLGPFIHTSESLLDWVEDWAPLGLSTRAPPGGLSLWWPLGSQTHCRAASGSRKEYSS